VKRRNALKVQRIPIATLAHRAIVPHGMTLVMKCASACSHLPVRIWPVAANCDEPVICGRILRMYRSATIRLLLVLLLLLSQTGGLTHGLAHTLEEQSQDQSQPHDELCELCAIYAQLGGSPASHTAQISPLEQHAVLVSAPAIVFPSPQFSAFAARAPPHSA
jgi:hypothetical protein